MLKTTSKIILLSAAFALPLTLQAKCGGATEAPSAMKVAPKTTISAHQANSAAYTLLAAMNMSESYKGMIKRVTQMQIQANPQLKAIEPTIQAFFDKYMGQ